jgi:hypothetical protein
MGSSGGGSSSGVVDYPDYMKNQHQAWLNALATLISNVTFGPSPFADAFAYNPDDAVVAALAAVCKFEAEVEQIDSVTDFASSIMNATLRFDAMAEIPTWVSPEFAAEAEIAADIAAFKAIQDDALENDILPRFRAGMRDINAVMSSSFILGQAYLEAANLRDVAKYQGDLRVRAFLLKDELSAKSTMAENDFNLKLELDRREKIGKFTDDMMRHIIARVEYEKHVSHYMVETRRIQMVAKSEESQGNLLMKEADAKWDLEAYQYGGNMLGAISGGVVPNTQKTASKMQSALGGAMSGAAAGAMMMPANPAMGAGLGAIVGLASSFL